MARLVRATNASTRPARRPPPGYRYVTAVTYDDPVDAGPKGVAMAVSAYILIQTEMDQAAEVARSIRDMDGVEATDVMTGPYDVIVKATASDMNSLGHMVISRIQAVGGITRTLTCPVVEI